MLAGMTIFVLVVFGIGGWAATAKLAGAVIGQGVVVVASRVKSIRHLTGGVVRSIRVHDGDKVKAGQILIQLDPTEARATAAIITNNIDDLAAKKSRLEAERDDLDQISFPPEMIDRATDGSSSAARAMAAESRFFKLRRAARDGQKAQFNERKAQLLDEIKGYASQSIAKDKELSLIQKELEGVTQLWQKKLTPLTRLVSLQRDAARIEGERSQLTSMIAQAKEKISEVELQIIQIDQDLRTEVGKNLTETNSKLSELRERKTAAVEQLSRTDIRAPQSGVVHELTAHTVGGVIKAGEQIMMIVPTQDTLEVEVRIRPNDIEDVHIGQNATLRFSALNQQTTPEINGKVTFIAADRVQDSRTGTSYYTTRLVFESSEMKKLNGTKILPGMPVEAFIQTGGRTAFSYLIEPVTEQAKRAFKQ
ncbi:MAG TPA: HlyD family type I secretion periplasmic adaptor subunit [Nitrospiraceae bacterium]|nr:HlyD family type I secretion periplasmic adaptor subunit [Nitrospiraceae bacterium]